MTMDVYYFPPSAPCRAVLLALKNLKIDFNKKIINLMTGEHLNPDFLKINPQHAVPAVNDKGFLLNESRPIMQYLVNTYARSDGLYPKDPKKRFVVDNRLAFDQGTLYIAFGELYYPMILDFPGASMDPVKVTRLNEVLGFVDGFLKKTAFAAGNDLTIADFAFAATLSTIEAVGHDLSPFPRIKQYMTKLKEEVLGYQEYNQDGADMFAQWAKPGIQKALSG